jgi:transcriptional regulator
MSESLQDALEMVIFKVLAAGPNHGFGIALYIEQTSQGLLHTDEGSLYPALHRLEKRGLIKADWKVTDSGRRARFYSLTAAGRKRLAQAEKSWTNLTRGIHLLWEAE